MKYFELTENIGDVERVFRVLSGIGLLGVTLLGPMSIMYSTIFPMLAAYFILTAIMKWDPVGYAIQIIFRMLDQIGPKASSHSPARRIKSI